MKAKESGDWLHSLTVMGRILLLTPFIAGLLKFLFEIVSGKDIEEILGVNLEGLVQAVGLVTIVGIVTLIYVAIKKFRQGLKGETESDDY